jgi:amidase
VIDYTPPNAAEGSQITTALFEADGGRDIAEAVALSGEPNLNGILSADSRELSTFEYWRLCLRRKQFITRQLASWESTSDLTGTGRPVDALIAPTAPYTSFTHDSRQYIGYTGAFNLTDQSVGIVPVTKVLKEDVKQEPHDFECEFDKVNYERCESRLLCFFSVTRLTSVPR